MILTLCSNLRTKEDIIATWFLVIAYGAKWAGSLVSSGRHFPGGKLPEPGFWLQDPDTRSKAEALDTQYLLPGAGHQMRGSACPVPRVGFQVPGLGYLVSKTWPRYYSVPRTVQHLGA
jgi:hypothetical protein